MTNSSDNAGPRASLEERLTDLPRKAGQAFGQLLAAEQLSEEALADILDAGELAGDRHRLIGFAIAYLQLRSQGVPVQHVIRMAREQGRRINLGWSPKRWRTEHDRLARAKALMRLSSENIHYDLTAYEKSLPSRFDGYLIRTSRRLGMEGFRQKHCVATYHPQIQRGGCAIAAVFVDRQRWTVELFRTNDPQAPLRLGQIRTRLNGCPAPEVIDAIRRSLGIAPRCQAGSPTTPAPGGSYLQALRQLLPVLRAGGVEQVCVTFSGSGDWGEIDWPYYDPRNRDIGDRAIILGNAAETSIDEAIRRLAEDYLEETEVDWTSDEGGFGELLIDVTRGTVTLDVCIRVVNSENAFWAERDILTGEHL